MSLNVSCYMCNSEAVTMEHVPPKCFFPKNDNTCDGDYRRRLITVPSCHEHNTGKSNDDQYLLYVLAGSVTSNDLGLTQFCTKVKRSAERKPKLMISMGSNAKPAQIFHSTGNFWEEGLGIAVDGNRIDLVLAMYAQAIYFHEQGGKFAGRVNVLTPFTLYLDSRRNASVSTALDAAENFFSDYQVKGENPEVFCYKFAENEVAAIILFYFYRGTKILVHLAKQRND